MFNQQNQPTDFTATNKLLKANSVSRYTSFSAQRNALLEPQFNMNDSFFARTLGQSTNYMLLKVVGITGVSYFFGLAMGMFMGSFDSTTSFGVDVRRSS